MGSFRTLRAQLLCRGQRVRRRTKEAGARCAALLRRRGALRGRGDARALCDAHGADAARVRAAAEPRRADHNGHCGAALGQTAALEL